MFWIKLAEAHYGAQDYEHALAAVNKLLACSPEHADGLLWKGVVLASIGQRKTAIAAYREAGKFESHRQTAQDQLGIALKDSGQFDEALRLFEAAKARRPQDSLMWRQIGYVNGKMGRSGQHWPVGARQGSTAAVGREASTTRSGLVSPDGGQRRARRPRGDRIGLRVAAGAQSCRSDRTA